MRIRNRNCLCGVLERSRMFAVVGMAVVLSLLPSVPALAQRSDANSSSEPSAAAARLTQSFVALNARYHGAGSGEHSRVLNDLLTAAAERRQLLASLIEDNPGEVLRAALPADVRANLPPVVRGYVEEEVEAEGELQVWIEDYADKSRTRYFLESAGERLALHFAANPPKHLMSGARVRVKGVRVDGAVALASGGASLETLALGASSTSTTTLAASAPLPNTFGEQKTLVILVNFQDNTTQPYTPAFVQNLVFNDVSNFYRENSFQQTWLSGNVFGWYKIPVLSTTCDTPLIASEAKKAAAAAGADLSLYSRFVYMFPTNACGWAGLAWGGSQAFINGAFTMPVVGHEFGHNLGLVHSHGLDCDTSPLGLSCNSLEYGDGADIMGNGAGHFNAFQKEYLGWLNNGAMPPITTVQSSGNYTLDPYEVNSVNPKALKILKSTDPSTGAKTWYYVEYRQSLGFDSVLNGVGNMVSGVQIRTGSEEPGVSSFLLDMTPNSILTSGFSDLDDGALAVGRSFTDSAAGVTITLAWANGTGAGVGATFNQTCVRVKPSVSISPSQSASVAAGTPVAYTVTVINNDSVLCGSSTFNLQASVPSGWSGAFAAPALTIGARGVASTTLTVTSPTSSVAGSYGIGATVTNSANTAYNATASATYVVASVSAAVSTDKTSYAGGDTVTITASVTAGGKPLANASVSFTVTKPNGVTATQTATTSTSGQAVYKLRLNKQKDPAGIYQARASSTSNGQTAAASTSFTVQ